MPGFLKRFGLFAGGSALGALVDYLATLALTQLFGISPAFALGLAMLLSATGVFFWHEHVTFGVAGRLGQGRRYLVFMVWSGAVFLLRAGILLVLQKLGLALPVALGGAIVIASLINYLLSAYAIFRPGR